MTYEFDEPDAVGGDRLNPKDCVGHLLMVWAVGYIDHSPTKFTVKDRPSDVIVVDVVNLDEPDEDGYQGRLYRGCWWRQSRLIGSLRNRIGKGPVLAWMGQGVATMGFPPYELRSANQDPESVARGQAWLAGHPDFTPGLRAAPTAPSPQEPAAPARQPSMLERIAAQQAETLKPVRTALPPAPPRPPQSDEPPF